MQWPQGTRRANKRRGNGAVLMTFTTKEGSALQSRSLFSNAPMASCDGYVSAFLPHGTCAVRYTDGAEFAGSMQHARRHGHGQFVCQLGTLEGDFCQDLPHGPCHLSMQVNDFDIDYIGDYRNGLKQGGGVLTITCDSAQARLEGTFVDDKFARGSVSLTREGKQRYRWEGSLAEGGTLTHLADDGSEVQAEVAWTAAAGGELRRGTLFYRDAAEHSAETARYTGDLVPQRFPLLTLVDMCTRVQRGETPNKEVFDDLFLDLEWQRSGRGTVAVPSGHTVTLCETDGAGGVTHREMTLMWPCGHIYTGHLDQRGRRHGHGCQIWLVDGEVALRYDGSFDQDRRHGRAEVTFSRDGDGRKIDEECFELEFREDCPFSGGMTLCTGVEALPVFPWHLFGTHVPIDRTDSDTDTDTVADTGAGTEGHSGSVTVDATVSEGKNDSDDGDSDEGRPSDGACATVSSAWRDLLPLALIRVLRMHCKRRVQQLRHEEGKAKDVLVCNGAMCMLCRDRSVETVLVPCGHTCMCRKCVVLQVAPLTCPCCEQRVQRVVRIFRA
ncbi:MAG: hypothetical protein MHM6MM_008033 [Cercozoa sp. M6MM]